MRTPLEKTTAAVVGKRDKPKTKTKAVMENLFNLEEDDIARYFHAEMPEDKVFSVEQSTVTEDATPRKDSLSIFKEAKTSSKGCKTKKTVDCHNTNTLKKTVQSTHNEQVSTLGTEEESGRYLSERGLLANTSVDVATRVSKNTTGLRKTLDGKQANSIDRISFRELDEVTATSKNDEAYTEGITNEETKGKPKQTSSVFEEDLSFELNEEFFVELSDLEFGDSDSLEESTNDSSRIDHNVIPQEGEYTSKEVFQEKQNKKVDLSQDESFELPDGYAAIDDRQLVDAEEKFDIDDSVKGSSLSSLSGAYTTDATSSLDDIGDDKFDLDELINAGTNSYTYQSKPKEPDHEYYHESSCRSIGGENSQKTEAAVFYNETDPKESISSSSSNDCLDNHSNQSIESKSNNSFLSSWRNVNESNTIPFGKKDTLEQILQAWAFGDTVTLIQMGKESSLEDEPFYSGDDDNFPSNKRSNKRVSAANVEVIEHPLARYGLKVRTINAIDFVGEKNYYSLSEETRRELEVLIQDLSKTEEGTVRNSQIKQAIYNMFS